MEEPMAMARLMWIVSELGFATRFPKETIILQKPSPDEDPECWRMLRTPSATLHAVTLS